MDSVGYWNILSGHACVEIKKMCQWWLEFMSHATSTLSTTVIIPSARPTLAALSRSAHAAYWYMTFLHESCVMRGISAIAVLAV